MDSFSSHISGYEYSIFLLPVGYLKRGWNQRTRSQRGRGLLFIQETRHGMVALLHGWIPAFFLFFLGGAFTASFRQRPHVYQPICHLSPAAPSCLCRVNYQTNPCVISSAMKHNLFAGKWSVPRAAQMPNSSVAAQKRSLARTSQKFWVARNCQQNSKAACLTVRL